MDRHKFKEANFIYETIKLEEAKKSKLLGLKNQFSEIMADHFEIPQGEIFDLFIKIEKMSEYIDAIIQKAYKQIDEL